ncbi:MAG: hypothetical protein FJ224_06720 [Lentisphaerae bacterium]|nr:hypothetical protein [Lentisphaerota bacterium]
MPNHSPIPMFRFALRAAVCVALLAAIPRRAEARVFFRWGRAGEARRAVESLGGTSVYSGAMSINGAPGELTVFACPADISGLARRMNEAVGSGALVPSGAAMAAGAAESGGRHYRFIAIRLTARHESILFCVEQTRSAFEESGKPPEKHLLTALPAYPGSSPSFFAEQKDRRTSLSVSVTPDAPGAVRSYYADRLEAAGWKPAFPATGDAGGAGMTVYLRGEEVCCCMAETSPDTGETRITLLHKRRSMN